MSGAVGSGGQRNPGSGDLDRRGGHLSPDGPRPAPDTMRCPGFDELLSHLAGGDAGVAAHLASGCASCARRVELLGALRATFAAGPLPEVPTHLSHAALAIPQEETAAGERGESPGMGALARIRELFARPLIDTASLGLAPALRGDDEGSGPIDRHLLFEAGPYEVDLAVVEGGSLVGQVLCDEADEPALAGAVCVLLDERDAREERLCSNGDFRFEDVGPGRYALFVESAELRLVVPELDLTEPT